MMARFLRLLVRFEDHWFADVLALVGLWGFGISTYLLLFGMGL